MGDANSSGNRDANTDDAEVLKQERYEVLRRLEAWLETPMLALAFVWLALLVAELVRGQSPLLDLLGTVIWGVFLLDFAVKFVLAPAKVAYLRANWLLTISLLIPALRLFRVFRVFRVFRWVLLVMVLLGCRGLRRCLMVVRRSLGMW